MVSFKACYVFVKFSLKTIKFEFGKLYEKAGTPDKTLQIDVILCDLYNDTSINRKLVRVVNDLVHVMMTI